MTSTEVALSVVTCPTASAGGQTATTTLPASITVDVPGDLAGQLAVYADTLGVMRLLGPKDWECSASYGADGSGGIKIYAAGEAVPNSVSFSPSSEQAVVGHETSACQICREEQACPLFASAAADYHADYDMPCPTVAPSEETTDQLRAGVVAFTDPPGVAGDGNPSGGPFPADGVMTYYSGDQNGSWLDTCTLPAGDMSVCTAVLNTFVAWYGAE